MMGVPERTRTIFSRPTSRSLATPAVRVYNYDRETSLCAGATVGEHDTCFGDSGGPLVVSLASGEVLLGATSYGDAKDCGNVYLPGVYTWLAADPIRSRVQTLVQQLAGVDVVG